MRVYLSVHPLNYASIKLGVVGFSWVFKCIRCAPPFLKESVKRERFLSMLLRTDRGWRSRLFL